MGHIVCKYYDPDPGSAAALRGGGGERLPGGCYSGCDAW